MPFPTPRTQLAQIKTADQDRLLVRARSLFIPDEASGVDLQLNSCAGTYAIRIHTRLGIR